MFGAIKQENGLYSIVECYPYRDKTYRIKNKLNDLCGKWNPRLKIWEDIKEDDLSKIPASKQVRVRVEKCCHEEEHDRYFFEHEIDKNGFVRVSCGWCDSFGLPAKVIKKYD